MKYNLKLQAIRYRKQGLSYSEILEKIPVARSTLSLWLREVGLSIRQKQRLSEKKLLSAKKGAQAVHNKRILLEKTIKQKARKEIGKITSNELWLIGIMLYWAEGSKAKGNNVSQGIIFSNSDPLMIKLFLKWLIEIIHIPKDRIGFELYIHETKRSGVNEIKKFWSSQTGYLGNKFGKIYYKRDKKSSNRKNTGKSYYGLIRVKVSKSTNLNRKISGWIEGICRNCGVV